MPEMQEEKQRAEWQPQPPERPYSALLDRGQVSGHMTRLASKQAAGSSSSHAPSQSHASCQQDAAAPSAEEKQAAAAEVPVHSNSASGQGIISVKEEFRTEMCFNETCNTISPEILVIKKELISDTYFEESTDVLDTDTVITKLEINYDMCFDEHSDNFGPLSTIIKTEENSEMSLKEWSDFSNKEDQLKSEQYINDSSDISPLVSVKSDPDSDLLGETTFEHKRDLLCISSHEQRIVSANDLHMPGAKLTSSGMICHQLTAESQQRNASSSEEHKKSSKNCQQRHMPSFCQSPAEVLHSDVSMVSQSQATNCQYVLVETQSEDASSAWQPDESEMSKSESDCNLKKKYLRSVRKLCCHFCQNRFYTIKAIRHHLAMAHNCMLMCKKCRTVFTTGEQLQTHSTDCISIFKKKPSLACDICKKNKLLCSSYELRVHKALVHKSEPYCRMCRLFFPSFMELNDHTSKLTNKTKCFCNACDICHKYFPSPFFIRFHKASVHNSEPFCKACQKILKSSEILQAHGATCTGKSRNLRS